jgi:hypothetical protein
MGARLTIAKKIQAATGLSWQEISDLVKSSGGKRQDARGDDVFVFTDGSRCRIRGLTFVAGRYSHRNERNAPAVEIEPRIAPLFTGDILAVIGRLQFKFASSMPQIPHEYTLRLETKADDDYVFLFDAIMQSKIIAAWQGTKGTVKNQKPLRYLHAGGYWYWSMSSRRTVTPHDKGRHPLWLSHHINRCTDNAWGKTNMVILRGKNEIA